MRLGRHEILLIAGLLLALGIVFFWQSFHLLGAVREFEATYGLGLLPGLAVGGISLAVYVYAKRRPRQYSPAPAPDASGGSARARELERLIAFWQALTQSLDLDAIRDTAELYLSELSGGEHGWMVSGMDGDWHVVIGPQTITIDGQDVSVVELATEALHSSGLMARPDGIEHRGQVCFPMIAAGSTLGAVGFAADPERMPHARRVVVGAAAALLAVSVRSVQLLQAVREASLRDALTGCVNRGHALEVISAELQRARRSRHPVSMIMLDVDRFKRVNDRYGHLCGDAVLAEVGARIRAALRGSDLKCRYGGEEFLLLLPETPLEGARRVAEQLRRDIAALEIPWGDVRVRITSSFGIAVAAPDELDPNGLIARADQALYRAKREGRDCIRIADANTHVITAAPPPSGAVPVAAVPAATALPDHPEPEGPRLRL